MFLFFDINFFFYNFEMWYNIYKVSAMIQSLNFESEISDEDITAFVKLIFDSKQ